MKSWVTALGIKREQKALSYNVQQVKSDELTQIKDANFINSLNGKWRALRLIRVLPESVEPAES